MIMPKLLEPIHPGEILLEEFLKPMDIGVTELARDIGVPAGRISQIVRGRRAITADTALRLARYLGMSPETWLGLQCDYEIRLTQRAIGKHIERTVKRRVA